MDEQLLKYLQEMEGRLGQRLGRMEQRLDQLDQRLVDVEQRLTAKIEERTEAVETRLLTEFHKWASTYEPRARGLALSMRT